MATQQLANNLTSAMLNQDDPDTVRAGAPAYLLLLDGMISDHPDDPSLLIAGARLYSALAGGLIRDPARKKLMTNRARVYARQALCLKHITLCTNEAASFDHFAVALNAIDIEDPV
ncbi:MAG: TRAP transporter TatT component family protein, partial [Sedimenticola sp.]|nr:TRAP transporter TatT component family protein [Sedimenticola sp.]